MRYDYETKGSIERSPRDDRKAIPSLQSRGKGGNKSWWRRAICCRTRCYAANNRTGKSGESNGSAQPSRRRVGDSKRVSQASFSSVAEAVQDQKSLECSTVGASSPQGA